MIELTAQKTRLSVDQSEQITSGSVNVYTVHFHFGTPWDGLEKVAVFNIPGKTINVPVKEDNTCIIPWEVTTDYGLILRVGVYGIKTGEVVLPTIWTTIGTIVQGVTLGGAEAGEHTPDIYDLILQKVQELLEYITNLENDIEAIDENIPTDDEILAILQRLINTHPSLIDLALTDYFRRNPLLTTSDINSLIQQYLASHQVTNISQSVVNGFIQQYLTNNTVTNISQSKVNDYIKSYLTNNPIKTLTREEVQQMIDESVGAAIATGY